MIDDTRVDSTLKRLKNHRVIAALIVVGMVLTALGSLTDALEKIGNLVQRNSRPEGDSTTVELVNRQLRPVYFDLKVPGSGSLNSDAHETDQFQRRSELDEQGVAKLAEYADILRNLSVDYTLLIEGHTVRRRISLNIALAETRVQNVFDYLQQLGIPPERMKTVALGGEEWDGANDPYSERVEFRLFVNSE